MILPDSELIKWAVGGGVNPYRKEQVNPASVDLRLGTEIIELRTGKRLSIQETGTTISHGNPVLATTVEYIKMPSVCAGVLYLKSSLARQGLDHALAGFIDPGFEGELTLELHAHRDVHITPGQRIVQLVLYRLENSPDRLYQGRYQGQQGPVEFIPAEEVQCSEQD